MGGGSPGSQEQPEEDLISPDSKENADDPFSFDNDSKPQPEKKDEFAFDFDEGQKKPEGGSDPFSFDDMKKTDPLDAFDTPAQ